MEPDDTYDGGQLSKRVKVDETSSVLLKSLEQQYRKLIDNEYLFLQRQLNGFKTAFEQNKKHLMKILSDTSSPQLQKGVDVLKDVQKKQEKLHSELDKDLLSIRNEAIEIEQKEMVGLSPSTLIMYFKQRIALLQKMQFPAVDSSTTQDNSSVEFVQENSLPSAISDAQSPSLSLQANEELGSSSRLLQKDSDIDSDPLQFQLKRLAQYQSMKECPLHYKFKQRLSQANDLLVLQQEQLTITTTLQTEIWSLEEKVLQKSIAALSPSAQGNEENMCNNEPPLTKKERKMLKQLKKERKRLEKIEKFKRDPSRCQFFVAHKNRYCRMLVVSKKLYCGQHLVMDQEPDGDGIVRIPCPLDPKHSVYQHQLAQHLTVCNARAPTHLPYYSASRNCGPLHEDQEEESIRICNMSDVSPKTSELNGNIASECNASDGNWQDHLFLSGKSIADLTDQELLALIKIVMKAEKDHTEAICKEELLHPSMRIHLQNKDGSLGPSVRKHLLQNASLVAHLEAVGAFVGRQVEEFDSNENLEAKTVDSEQLPGSSESSVNVIEENSDEDLENQETYPSCFLEFGAGKGQLSHWVVNASSSSQSLQTVLIDRGSQRYKFDSRINEAKHVSAVRLRVDIADLALERVEGVPLTGRVFAGGKHLCGAATDLSVRCLLRSGVLPSSSGQCGLVIALCCHHRCSWQHYTGKSFLKRVGLGGDNFPALLGLSSWAVCEARPPGAAVAGARTQDARGSDQTSSAAHSSATVDHSAAHDPLEKGSDSKDSAMDVTPSQPSIVKFSDGSSSSDVGLETLDISQPSSSKDTNNQQPSLATKSVALDERDSILAEHDIEREDAGAVNRYVRLGLSIGEREEIGRAAKHLINHGRLLHLRNLGMEAKLVYYVDREVTLENVAIVAHN